MTELQAVLTAISGCLVATFGLLLGAWRLHIAKMAKIARRVDYERAQQEAERVAQIAELERLHKEILDVRHQSIAPDSLAAAEAEHTRRKAREQGFEPGATGRFRSMNSIGSMRCDSHDDMIRSIDDVKAAAERSCAAAMAAIGAANQATAAAGIATAAVERIGEMVREIAATLSDLREWKGAIGARLENVEARRPHQAGGR